MRARCQSGQRYLPPLLHASNAQIWDEDNNEWRDDFQNSYAYNGRDYLTTLTQQVDTDGTDLNNAVAYKRVELIYDVADQLDQISRYASAGTSQLVATRAVGRTKRRRERPIPNQHNRRAVPAMGCTVDASAGTARRSSGAKW